MTSNNMPLYHMFVQVVGCALVELAPQLARDNDINNWANDESDVPDFPLTKVQVLKITILGCTLL